MATPLLFAVGGTRSGKSRWALAQVSRLAGDRARVWFLATAIPGDPELDDRIARHRQERPAAWPTVEVWTDLAAALAATDPDDVVIVDGLTLWLSALLRDDIGPADIDPILDGPVATGLAAIAAHRGPVIVVSDDVSGGIVPMHPGARAFRDLAGITHQRLAAMADVVVLMVAGLPMTLKGDE